MTWERAGAITRASQLAGLFSSLKNLGLTDRHLLSEIMRGVLLANPGLLGVWTVWEPDALDGRDALFAGAPGHDQSGRFVPLWHRHGGKVQLEANTDYDEPHAEWYWAPTRQGAEVLIDPYEYRVAGNKLLISSLAAPIVHSGRCVGVAGFDIHMDVLLEASNQPNIFDSIEAVLGRGHVLLGEDGQVRYCSEATRQLICRYVGGKRSCGRPLDNSLDILIQKLRWPVLPETREVKPKWSFRNGHSKLIVRFTHYSYRRGALLLVDEEADDGSSSGTEVPLSPREQEVADWVAQGKTNEEIAIILGISSHTVKNHLDKIFRKLGVYNRCGAAMAIRGNLAQRDTSIGRPSYCANGSVPAR
jgi:DNA-binding CsgD family transcriptional regulator